MEKREYLIILFDYYNKLLTNHEIECFKSYYDNDYSLSEIATDYDTSRTAVHNTIKRVSEKLTSFEEKLNLYKKKEEIISILEKEISRETLDKLKDII